MSAGVCWGREPTGRDSHAALGRENRRTCWHGGLVRGWGAPPCTPVHHGQRLWVPRPPAGAWGAELCAPACAKCASVWIHTRVPGGEMLPLVWAAPVQGWGGKGCPAPKRHPGHPVTGRRAQRGCPCGAVASSGRCPRVAHGVPGPAGAHREGAAGLMCGGLSRADGSSVACQPLALENGASPPAEWFQGSGPRQPGSDGDGRSFRVNLHCKHPRNRYLGPHPKKRGAGTKGELAANPAADVLSVPAWEIGARGSPARDFGVNREGLQPPRSAGWAVQGARSARHPRVSA